MKVQPPWQGTAWELDEPTLKQPDVGLNWLVKSTKSLQRSDGQPNLAAIGRLTGISYSALNAVLPMRRGQRDFRTMDQTTLGRIALAGSLLNNVPESVAHAKIFRLVVPDEARVELAARVAELEKSSAA